MDPNDIAAALDAIAQKWDQKRAEYWDESQTIKDNVSGARVDRMDQRTTAYHLEQKAALAKEASNDAYELAARVRGLLV